MARQCDLCGKGPTTGQTYARRGIAKSKGGVGIKTVRRTPRRFLPNLQRIRIVIGGGVRQMRVCTGCIRSNRIIKAP